MFTTRSKIKIFWGIILTLAISAFIVSAQKTARDSQPVNKNGQSREMIIKSYKDKTIDGLSVKLLDVKGNPIDPAGKFKTGDELKVGLISNFAGYVYFVNISPEGKTRVFWNTEVKADESYTLPYNQNVVTFSGKKGIEVFKVILSKDKIEPFENAIRKSNGWLGQTKEYVKTNVPSLGIAQSSSEMTCRGLGFDPDSKIHCRGLGFAPENNEEKTTIVAITDNQGEMKTGDFIVFELRLKHI